jgi:hypothetical protein
MWEMKPRTTPQKTSWLLMGPEEVTRPETLEAIIIIIIIIIIMTTTNVWVYWILTRPENIVFFGCDAVWSGRHLLTLWWYLFCSPNPEVRNTEDICGRELESVLGTWRHKSEDSKVTVKLTLCTSRSTQKRGTASFAVVLCTRRRKWSWHTPQSLYPRGKIPTN